MILDAATRNKMRFVLITDRKATPRPLLEVVEGALRGGFRCVQLREKDLSARELHALAEPMRELTRKYDALLLINDRVDVALAVRADGVHLGWQSLDALAIRSYADHEDIPLLGGSAHNIVEVRKFLHSRVDYLLFGPVHATPSKDGLVEPVGLEQLRKMAVPSPVPVVAVGGINASNVAGAMQARAAGVAVIRAIMAADDPCLAAQQIIAAAPDPLPIPAEQSYSF